MAWTAGIHDVVHSSLHRRRRLSSRHLTFPARSNARLESSDAVELDSTAVAALGTAVVLRSRAPRYRGDSGLVNGGIAGAGDTYPELKK